MWCDLPQVTQLVDGHAGLSLDGTCGRSVGCECPCTGVVHAWPGPLLKGEF